MAKIIRSIPEASEVTWQWRTRDPYSPLLGNFVVYPDLGLQYLSPMSSALAGNVRQERARGPHRVPNGARAGSSSEIASLVRQLKPRFLEGLTQPEVQSVLAAAPPGDFW
jgi:hypothetical protein